MRKLTKNEVIELRACKDMDHAREEFFARAARMYADDPEAVARIEKMETMMHDIREMANEQEGSVRSLEMSRNMYFDYVDQLLEDMGYSAKPDEEKKEELIDVLKGIFRHKK
ncbi:MAG: hypothetical protein IJR62_04115 [Lachnospiraceae bacterium]|nr:hypothetical protein [Lachnospiraceae bacterium]